MKKAIHQVAADVLAEHKRPMTADEYTKSLFRENSTSLKPKARKAFYEANYVAIAKANQRAKPAQLRCLLCPRTGIFR